MSLESWIDEVVAAIDQDDRVAFVLDPRTAVTERFGLVLREVAELSKTRSDGGFCDGMSFLDDGVVLLAPTPNSRRENFTIAHEVGHWLVQKNTRLFDWIADQTDPVVALETVCDRIAQRLLLPADLVASVLTDGPVRARHVVDLYEASAASYPACAIAVARRLPGLGAVVLLSRWDRSVTHASIRPDNDDGWPAVVPWRGHVVPDGHPLLRVPAGGGMTRRISWRSPWGAQAEFFADAVADDSRIVVVLADDDVWKSERGRVLEPRIFDRRPVGTVYCCGQTQQRRGYPCRACGEQFCSFCQRCRCDRAATKEQPCLRCFVLRQPQLLVDDLCEDCR